MLKEADVSKKGLFAFRECLSVVPSLTIDSIEELPAKDIPDYQAIVRGEGFKQIIYLEVNYHPLKQVVFWRFQCPSGHFLIQTAFFSLPPGAQKTPAGRLFLQIPTHYTHFWASMPSFLPSHPSKQPVFAPPGAAGAMLRTPPPRKPIFWQNQGGGAQIPPAAAK